jgi:hypothetical protein
MTVAGEFSKNIDELSTRSILEFWLVDSLVTIELLVFSQNSGSAGAR